MIESRLVESYLTLTQADRRDAGQGGRDETRRPRRTSRSRTCTCASRSDKAKSKLALEQANRSPTRTTPRRAAHARGRLPQRDPVREAGDLPQPVRRALLLPARRLPGPQPEARWQRMAEENYTRATQLDPWNAGYWVSLGRFYKKRGLKLRAKKQFEEALKLVPNKPGRSSRSWSGSTDPRPTRLIPPSGCYRPLVCESPRPVMSIR